MTRYGGSAKNRFRSYREGPFASAAFRTMQKGGGGYANALEFSDAATKSGIHVLGKQRRLRFGSRKSSSGGAWDESKHPRDDEGKWTNA